MPHSCEDENSAAVQSSWPKQRRYARPAIVAMTLALLAAIPHPVSLVPLASPGICYADTTDQKEAAVDVQLRNQSTQSANIGMEGTYFLRHAGPQLKVRPADEMSPITLRIVKVTDDEKGAIYELRYSSDYVGDFNLLDYLMTEDGQPITDVRPAMVIIREMLPPDHTGKLETLDPPEEFRPLRYKLLLVTFATLWLVPGLWALLTWLSRQTPR